jgi:hypothetical protein
MKDLINADDQAFGCLLLPSSSGIWLGQFAELVDKPSASPRVAEVLIFLLVFHHHSVLKSRRQTPTEVE